MRLNFQCLNYPSKAHETGVRIVLNNLGLTSVLVTRFLMSADCCKYGLLL